MAAAELDDQVSAAFAIARPRWSATDACTTCVAPMAFSETEPGCTVMVVATLGGVESEHPHRSSVARGMRSGLRMVGGVPGGFGPATETRAGGGSAR